MTVADIILALSGEGAGTPVQIQLNAKQANGGVGKHLLQKIERVEIHPKRVVLVVEMSLHDRLLGG
jgi:hypothetical protein